MWRNEPVAGRRLHARQRFLHRQLTLSLSFSLSLHVFFLLPFVWDEKYFSFLLPSTVSSYLHVLLQFKRLFCFCAGGLEYRYTGKKGRGAPLASSLSLSLSPSPVLKKTFHFSFPLFFFSSCCCCCCRLVIIGISIVIIINSRYQWRNQSTAIQTTVKSKMKKEKSLKHKQRGWERGRGRGRELFVSLLAKEKKRKEKKKTRRRASRWKRCERFPFIHCTYVPDALIRWVVVFLILGWKKTLRCCYQRTLHRPGWPLTLDAF